jgi:hypothetical protein
MHPSLKKAIDRANEHIDTALEGNTRKALRKEELAKMTWEQLFALVVQHENLDAADVKVGETCAAILCDPDCVWLSYDMIHALLHSRIDGIKTSVANVAWYSSHYQNEQDRDVQLRKPVKEITKMMLSK